MSNQLRAVEVPAGELPVAAALSDSYLTDESRMHGQAQRLYFPQTEPELIAILKAAQETGTPVTLSGGRTGLTGGAVPQAGWLVSLEKMNRVLGCRAAPERREVYLRCQPGVTLAAIDKALADNKFPDQDRWLAAEQALWQEVSGKAAWLFPPDPTERTATLGGMVACNASGARTFFYGPTRPYVSRLRVILMGGAVLDLTRGASRAAAAGAFELVLPDGQVQAGHIPAYTMPAVKNAAGYFSAPDMDLLDLFIGSEGTLGLFSEIEIRLIPAPETILGVIGFFPSEPEALKFVRAARGEIAGSDLPKLPDRPVALEYFDVQALNLLRDQKQKVGPSSPIPALPAEAHTAVYIEIATTEARLEDTAGVLMELLEACHSRSDNAWTALTPEETERLKTFRHALPETINQRIGERAQRYPGLTKLATDFAVPDAALDNMLAADREALSAAGLEYAIFGHIGNNHVHVNILPRNLDEYARGKALYLYLARKAVGWGGTVSAEHGVGKLKKPFLLLMYGDSGIAAMRAVKRVFDPAGLLNPGNMFD